MARRWSPDEDELLVKLRDEGFTSREIAVRVNRTADAVRVRLAAVAKRRKSWTKQEEELLIELKQKGLTNRRIAFELGRTTRAVEAKSKELLG